MLIQHFYDFTVKISEYVSSVWTVLKEMLEWSVIHLWLQVLIDIKEKKGKEKKTGQVKNWLVSLLHSVTQTCDATVS